MIKKILIVLLIAFIAIQFFHPAKNKADGEQPNHIGNVFAMSEDVKSILSKACYDCHSNNTRYPWYSNVQPVDWFLNKHIKKGKSEINFDEFTNRSLRFQYHKMEEIEEQIKEGKMPLNSYTWLHKDAKLTDAEKNTLIAWSQANMDSLKAKYPIDSLIRKKQ
ncbi:MAG: heme-binding domain-containing protein [Bacteroidetes bacterium]|nr:heme-binding domain-containing protein [Bacteroidota bacterium]MBS1632327.1 heme-binding domain-containing protein [Bacteroidota bacterium]